MKIIIETERLLLREITLDDKEELFQLYTNSEVLKYTGELPVGSMGEMEQAIQIRISNYEKYGYGRWATILKSEKQFVGWAGLAYLPEFDEVDIGYRFFPQYWGLGIATEASEAILEYGFKQLELEKIVALAMEENIASIRVMEKIGMKFYKIAPYEQDSQDAIWYYIDKKTYARK